jgi:hypothetical protein
MVVLRASRRCVGVCAVVLCTLAAPAGARPREGCSAAQATKASVGRPTARLAWRAQVVRPTPVRARLSGSGRRIAIHGRGAGSLLDPLGSARSHGCVRVPNDVVDRLVRRVGPDALPGVRVAIR